jgi:hypothetical protein
VADGDTKLVLVAVAAADGVGAAVGVPEGELLVDGCAPSVRLAVTVGVAEAPLDALALAEIDGDTPSVSDAVAVLLHEKLAVTVAVADALAPGDKEAVAAAERLADGRAGDGEVEALSDGAAAAVDDALGDGERVAAADGDALPADEGDGGTLADGDGEAELL